MSQTDDFVATVLPRLREAGVAFHHGDAAPNKAMWSRQDPLTLLGAAKSGAGWAEIEPVFDLVGSWFADCTSYEVQLVAAEVSGDLAYVVAFEHTTASVRGAPAEPYTLRVTTVFRREDGDWKIVHRHGDPLAAASAELMQRLATEPAAAM